MSPTELDAQIRAAETTAYAHYGLEPRERLVAVETPLGPVAVRVTLFGPSASAEPPVVLLHGVASPTVIAAPLTARLTGRQVIAVDWPGHGLSGPSLLPRGTGLRQYAVAVLRALLDELELTQVDVVGHSLGAQFGLYAALDLPGRVRRLVLLGAPGAAFEGVRPTAIMKVLAVPGLGRWLLALPMSRKAFLRANADTLGAGALEDVPDELIDAAMLIGRRSDYAPSVASYFRALIKRGSVRPGVAVAAGELATVRQPTLLVWGDEDVFMRPLAAADSIGAIRDGHLVRLAGAGHAPWLQEPQRVGDAVASHLGDPADMGVAVQPGSETA
jgi:pimeloyl-ACP methyl ester carboxylesterase